MCYRQCIVFLVICKNINEEEKKLKLEVKRNMNYKEFRMYSNFYLMDFGEVFTKNNAFQIKINNATAPEFFLQNDFTSYSLKQKYYHNNTILKAIQT